MLDRCQEYQKRRGEERKKKEEARVLVSYIGYSNIILGLYRDNGKENGNYYNGLYKFLVSYAATTTCREAKPLTLNANPSAQYPRAVQSLRAREEQRQKEEEEQDPGRGLGLARL